MGFLSKLASYADPLLVTCGAVDLAVNWAVWGFSSIYGTEKFFDLTGGSTFVLLSWLAFKEGGGQHLRQQVATGCVTAWGLRLSLFLFRRIIRADGDRRFEQERKKHTEMFYWWNMQAAWIFLTLSPVLLLNLKKAELQRPIDRIDYLGWGIFGVGWIMEVLADLQKYRFRGNPENANKFITHGLWSISRHPNYFGEIVLWYGLFVTSSRSFTRPIEYLTLVSPLFVTYVLTCLSGSNVLEEMADERWGKLPAYQLYKRNTALLVPWIW